MRSDRASAILRPGQRLRNRRRCALVHPLRTAWRQVKSSSNWRAHAHQQFNVRGERMLGIGSLPKVRPTCTRRLARPSVLHLLIEGANGHKCSLDDFGSAVLMQFVGEPRERGRRKSMWRVCRHLSRKS